MHNILMADDDREFCALIREYLSGHDFHVLAVHDGQAAIESADDEHAAIILDVMMPIKDGFDALREIRQQGVQIPILMLTARGEDVDRILGLEMGADDYLPKPCNPRELAARLKALLRRGLPVTTDTAKLQAGDIELDIARREAQLQGNPVELTSVEFEVLRTLAESAGSPVDRDNLMRAALGRRWLPTDRSLDMHIVALRRKFGNERIKTLRGKGYQLIK